MFGRKKKDAAATVKARPVVVVDEVDEEERPRVVSRNTEIILGNESVKVVEQKLPEGDVNLAKNLTTLEKEFAADKDSAENDQAALRKDLNDSKNQATLQKDVQTLEGQLRQLKAENEKLRKENSSAAPALSDVRKMESAKKLEGDNVALRRRCAELEESLAKAHKQAPDVSDFRKELEGSLSSLQKELKEAMTSRDALQKELVQLTEAMKRHESREAEQDGTLESLRSERLGLIEELERTREELLKALGESQASAAEQQESPVQAVVVDESDELHEEIDTLRKTLRERDARIEELCAKQRTPAAAAAPVATNADASAAPDDGGERYDKLHKRIQEMQKMCRSSIDRLESHVTSE